MRSKLLITLSPLLLFLTSCEKKDTQVLAQKYVHKYGFEVSENEWAAREKNGEVILVLKNGITQTSNYRSGKLHGAQTFTFPYSQVIELKKEFNEDRLVKETFYEISGLPLKEHIYEIDKTIITCWNRSGVPLSIEEYINGKIFSAQYYDNKNDPEGGISNGSGTRINRDRDGALLSQEVFENGDIASRKSYHSNGVLQSESFFVNNQLEGKQENFSSDGKLLSKLFWKKGKIDGLATSYRDNKVINEIPYVDGKKHGIEKEYDINGALTREIHWKNDKKHGVAKSYFNDYTDVQWYWQNMAVELKRFQELEVQNELMANSELKILNVR